MENRAWDLDYKKDSRGMDVNCYKCATTLIIDIKHSVARSEECPKCYSNVRCCRMCENFETSAYNECREPTADRILEKEKANFCDHYKIGTGDTYKDQKCDLKSAAESLFKK